MRPRVAVLGAGGMLGHKVFQSLQEQFPSAVGIVRNDVPARRIAGEWITGVDASNHEQLEATLRGLRPHYLVNCVGMIKQRAEAQDPITAITINALLPHRLAAVLEEWGGRLIHFSTDCVYSGSRGAYREEDPSDAVDLYGRTKFLGEVHSGNALTLRTSIIGRELSGRLSLLEWLLSQRGGSVSGFRRVIWSGVTTNHLAALVRRILQDHGELSGLYQVASEPISKYELLCRLKDAYSLPVSIAPEDSERSDRSMSGARIKQAIGYEAPPWQVLLTELASDPTPYESWCNS